MSREKKRVVVTATQEMPVNMNAVAGELWATAELEVVPLAFGDLSLSARERCWQSIARADGLLVRTGVIPYELIGRCSQLKIIALHGAGVDQVDVKAATEGGIYVTNTPGANAQSVAELALGLVISFRRSISQADCLVRQGRWEKARALGTELKGKRLGIVGYGNIGQTLAGIATALGMEVVFWSRSTQTSVVRGARPVPLEELFGTADIVSLHLALVPDTMGLVGRRLLSLMRKDALLVNTARGALVVQDDLLQALQEGWIAGAALDVFEQEPLPANSPFLSLPNVLFTPHMGGSTTECLARVAGMAARDIRLVLEGREPEYAANSPWRSG
ncbi:MAG: Hydroxypyruvate reductase [Firmicutes bacterium]|nr:Hydroxypyruvate reductase [candidate division NPL-UPA2 bacterium]MBT9154677.1 Hydroxypyruvate reductase [candidate division NPL-UPA2 bacterium]